jgi:DNA-binding GntR family transcriptional regulator
LSKFSQTHQQIKQRIPDAVDKAGKGVSTDFIAFNLSLSWGTVRSALMELGLEKRIKASQTTRDYIFFAIEKELVEA